MLPLSKERSSYDFDDANTNVDRQLDSRNQEQSGRYSRDSTSLLDRWSRRISGMGFLRTNGNHEYQAAPTEESRDNAAGASMRPSESKWRKSRLLKLSLLAIKIIPILILVMFGILHIILVILGRLSPFWDVEQFQHMEGWRKPGQVDNTLIEYPTDATRDVLPIPCHSHNDYWRKVPLFDAIHWGCTGVEADVWLLDGEEELLVGHDKASLTRQRTFRSLYIDPLVDLLDKMNPKTDFSNTTGHGVFDTSPDQTLVLLVDFKTNGPDLFPHVRQQLEPLRQKNYLSYWDGESFVSRAITVVGTGNTPFDAILENQTHRDIFFDAPLDELWEPEDSQEGETARMESIRSDGQGKTGTDAISSSNAFNSSNSYFASVSLKDSIGFPWSGRLKEKQLRLLRGQIRGAKRRGLKARYWDTPSWPTSLRNHVWQTLVEEGADVLNVDDLKAAASLDWTKVRHDWFDA